MSYEICGGVSATARNGRRGYFREYCKPTVLGVWCMDESNTVRDITL